MTRFAFPSPLGSGLLSCPYPPGLCEPQDQRAGGLALRAPGLLQSQGFSSSGYLTERVCGDWRTPWLSLGYTKLFLDQRSIIESLGVSSRMLATPGPPAPLRLCLRACWRSVRFILLSVRDHTYAPFHLVESQSSLLFPPWSSSVPVLAVVVQFLGNTHDG
ncbi:unnamed protein product [Pleuronectes platessa]|uniref:Uncharacterized protein n=1 Tax=Pleuronectes platessa TaxID=8262 RepID=A0A9N7TSX9_PLEPL|nr:unnamed protein product [Pleuronectes platessa]